MSNEEVEFIMDGIEELATNYSEWSKDYTIDLVKGIVQCKDETIKEGLKKEVDDCFDLAFG